MMQPLRPRPDEEHRRLYDLCVTDLIAAGITAEEMARYGAQEAVALVRESVDQRTAR